MRKNEKAARRLRNNGVSCSELRLFVRKGDIRDSLMVNKLGEDFSHIKCVKPRNEVKVDKLRGRVREMKKEKDEKGERKRWSEETRTYNA